MVRSLGRCEISDLIFGRDAHSRSHHLFNRHVELGRYHCPRTVGALSARNGDALYGSDSGAMTAPAVDEMAFLEALSSSPASSISETNAPRTAVAARLTLGDNAHCLSDEPPPPASSISRYRMRRMPGSLVVHFSLTLLVQGTHQEGAPNPPDRPMAVLVGRPQEGVQSR
jgi:hypothetical protein